MLSLAKYKNKKIIIYGMSKTGLSAAKIFKKLKANIFCWDDNKKVRIKLKSAGYKIEKFWLDKKLVDHIIISPGIDINKCKIKNYLKKNRSKIITDLDLFFELNKKALIISITGTNGKSTTCKIIETILKTAKLNAKTVGNIGNPILSSGEVKEKNILILELSSYQLEYSKLIRSKHAAILNISPDHLERHRNMSNYIKAKSKIFSAQKNTDFSYIDFNSKYLRKFKKKFKNKKYRSKLIQINNLTCNHLLPKISNEYFKSTSNIKNLSFAYKIVKNLNISDKIIIKAVNRFKGLPHRQETIISNKNLLCINDSKATSFVASLQSLLNYNEIYWIVGGLPKYKDKFNLKKVKNNIVKAYIVGNKISFFKNQVKNKVIYKISKNIKIAIKNIQKDLKRRKNIKSTILLSPAAASFDQFENFEQRGIYFKNLIKKKFRN